MHGTEDDFCSIRIPFEGFIELLYFAVGYYSSPPGLLDYYEWSLSANRHHRQTQESDGLCCGGDERSRMIRNCFLAPGSE